MKSRSSWQVYLLWPCLLGLSFAFAQGLRDSAWPKLSGEYLRFHFYATALHILAFNIDARVPLAVGVPLALFGLAWLGIRLDGPLRRCWRIVFPAVALIILASVYFATHLYHWILARQLVWSVARAIGGYFSHPLFLSMVLIALLGVAWLLRRSQRTVRRTETLSVPAASPALAILRHGARLTRRCVAGIAGIAIIGAAAGLLVVNLAFGVMRASRAAGLRVMPNVIFIMVDTLRPDHLGCYGYDLPTSPNIDRFARESTRFTRTVAQSSWTIWSVDSLLTSRFPDRLAPEHLGTTLGPASELHTYYPTFVEALKEQGFSTNAVISNPLLHKADGNNQGYDFYDDRPAFLNRECLNTSPHVNAIALQRLAKIKDRRFFLNLLYMDPHSPYNRNPGFDFGDSARDAPARARLAAFHAPKLIEQRQANLRGYDSEIGYTDYYVGEFLRELKKQGLYDDAMIVLFSDHGEEFLEHGHFGHEKTVYEEVIRVPLIIKLPHQRHGRIITGDFPLLDLVPSLLAELHIDQSALGFQGKIAHLPRLLHCASQPIYSSTIDNIYSVANSDYKLILGESRATYPEKIQLPALPGADSVNSADGRQSLASQDSPRYRYELFNLANDPSELHNHASRDYDHLKKLMGFLRERDARLLPSDLQFRNELLPSSGYQGADQAPNDLRDRLRSLGYLAAD